MIKAVGQKAYSALWEEGRGKEDERGVWNIPGVVYDKEVPEGREHVYASREHWEIEQRRRWIRLIAQGFGQPWGDPEHTESLSGPKYNEYMNNMVKRLQEALDDIKEAMEKINEQA